MDINFSLWHVLGIVGVVIIGCITYSNWQLGLNKERYEAAIKQKDATIEFLRENVSPNLSQWDSGTVECSHREEKVIKFNVKFTTPPAIITNLGNDVGDPIGIIIKSVTPEEFVLEAVGPPSRPFALGHRKIVIINWIALSKK